MLHADFAAVCVTEAELLAMGFSICGEASFTLREYSLWTFCFCDLELDPMTFIYELDPYCLEIHRMCKYELPT